MTPTETILATATLAAALLGQLVVIAIAYRRYRKQAARLAYRAVVVEHRAMLAKAGRKELDDPEPWPTRQTPTDLQAAYEDQMPPWPWRSLPLEPGLPDCYPVYEQRGVFSLRSDEAIIWAACGPGETTQTFYKIVATSYEGWKCPSCDVGRDGEGRHISCVGCACHCGDNQGAQVIPVGQHCDRVRQVAA